MKELFIKLCCIYRIIGWLCLAALIYFGQFLPSWITVSIFIVNSILWFIAIIVSLCAYPYDYIETYYGSAIEIVEDFKKNEMHHEVEEKERDEKVNALFD